MRFAAASLDGLIRTCFVFACMALPASLTMAQQPVHQQTTPAKAGESVQSSGVSDPSLKEMFESKVRVEWEALKNKDKNGYAELLADDYQGVEADGKGERNKLQALNELAETNVFNYTLWGFKVIPLGSDVTFVVYEITMQFPPKSQVRYSRVYISELWARRGGQWKELHYQETHVK